MGSVSDPKIRHCVGRRKHPAELAEPGSHHVAVSWLLSRWGGGWASGSGREGQAISGQPVRSGTRVYPSSLARLCRARTWRRVLARLS